jgi:hypothetical protein
MEAAIRSFLKDPAFGLPILLLLIVLVAHVAVYLRSVAQGATPIIPSLRVFSADIAIVLLAALMFAMSKAVTLFTPDEGTEIAGVDVGPLYAIVGPLVFGAMGLTLSGWLLVKKAQAIRDSVTPPAVTTTTITGVGLVPGDSTVTTTTTEPPAA